MTVACCGARMIISPANSIRNLCPLPNFSNFSAKGKIKCSCIRKEEDSDKGFSALPSDIPWDKGSIWSTMGLYFFSLHIPLSFGGLSVIAQLKHHPVLDPQTEVVSILGLQSIELWATLALLKYTAKSPFNLASFFHIKFSKERNWVQASAFGFGVLMSVAFLTSYLADRLVGPKVVNNPILKDIFSSGSISTVACFPTYNVITPLLKETIFRGFLLTSLTSTMKW